MRTEDGGNEGEKRRGRENRNHNLLHHHGNSVKGGGYDVSYSNVDGAASDLCGGNGVDIGWWS